MFLLVRIMYRCSFFPGFFVWVLITIVLSLLRDYLREKNIATFGGMRDGSYAESEAYDSASIMPIHSRSQLSSDSDSTSVASVTSVSQP